MNSHPVCLFVLLRFVAAIFGQKTTHDGCFTQYNSVKEGCLTAVQQKGGISQQDCTNLCVRLPTCKAVQYDSGKQQCSLFGKAGQLPQIGRKRRDDREGGKKSGERRNGGGKKGGHSGGDDHHDDHSKGHSDNGRSNGHNGDKSNGSREKQPNKCDGKLIGNSQGFTYYVPTGKCPGGPTNPPVTQPPVTTPQVTTQPATFAPTTPCPIVRQPQKLLVGYAEAVVTATSFQDCFKQCTESQTRFGFNCASGMFYNTDTSNCILNSESASTQPTLFIDETVDTVEYFEPCPPLRQKREVANLKPKRNRNVIWLNTTTWGSWTRCDGKQSSRNRFRQCKSFNPNKCEKADVTCDPKNRQQEWADIKKEEVVVPTAPPKSSEKRG